MTQYEQTLHEDPTDRSAQIEERDAAVALALLQRGSGDADGALATLERARHAIPGDATILLDLGIQAESMQRYRRAREVLEQALNNDPENGKVLYALARVEADEENFPAAQTHFQEYLWRVPMDATAHYGLARTYQRLQDTEKAKMEYERSIHLKPVQTEAYYQLGQIALDEGQTDEAFKEFQKVLDRLPDHGGALTGMGVLYYRLHSYAEACSYLKHAVAAAPDYEPAHYYLGQSEIRAGAKIEGEHELQAALRLAELQQGSGRPKRE